MSLKHRINLSEGCLSWCLKTSQEPVNLDCRLWAWLPEERSFQWWVSCQVISTTPRLFFLRFLFLPLIIVFSLKNCCKRSLRSLISEQWGVHPQFWAFGPLWNDFLFSSWWMLNHPCKPSAKICPVWEVVPDSSRLNFVVYLICSLCSHRSLDLSFL